MDFSGNTFSELVRQFAWRGTEAQKQVWECCENQAQSLPASLNHQSGKSSSSPLYINNLCLGEGKGGLGQTELLCCGCVAEDEAGVTAGTECKKKKKFYILLENERAAKQKQERFQVGLKKQLLGMRLLLAKGNFSTNGAGMLDIQTENEN